MAFKCAPKTKKHTEKNFPLVPDHKVRLENNVGDHTSPPVVPHGDQWCNHQPHAGVVRTRTPRAAGPETGLQNILDVVGEDGVGHGEHHLETEARAPDLGRQGPALLNNAEQIVSSISPSVVPKGTDHGPDDVAAEGLERIRLLVPPVLAPLVVGEAGGDYGDALVAERLTLADFVD